jgi:hypothetical protein
VIRRGAFAAALVAALGSVAAARAEDDATYSPKLSIRTSNGLLTNRGSSGGSTFSVGGLNVLYLHFLNPKLALGLGYRIHPDFSNSSIPVYGFEAAPRYYFWGEGTHTRTRVAGGTSERRDRYAFYAGVDFGLRSFFVGQNPNITSTGGLTGSFLSISGSVGADLRLSRHFELTAEGNMSLLTFSSSDSRVRISAMVANFGVSYVW